MQAYRKSRVPRTTRTGHAREDMHIRLGWLEGGAVLVSCYAAKGSASLFGVSFGK